MLDGEGRGSLLIMCLFKQMSVRADFCRAVVEVMHIFILAILVSIGFTFN